MRVNKLELPMKNVSWLNALCMKLQITEYWKHENHHKNDGLKDHKLLQVQ